MSRDKTFFEVLYSCYIIALLHYFVLMFGYITGFHSFTNQICPYFQLIYIMMYMTFFLLFLFVLLWFTIIRRNLRHTEIFKWIPCFYTRNRDKVKYYAIEFKENLFLVLSVFAKSTKHISDIKEDHGYSGQYFCNVM